MRAASQALAAYGATLAADGHIVTRSGERLSVRIVRRGGRYRYESSGGHLVGSSPATAAGVHRFVQSYWYWTPNPPWTGERTATRICPDCAERGCLRCGHTGRLQRQ